MPETPNNPPAFPCADFVVDTARLQTDGYQKLGALQGMTLRDYFAAKALQVVHGNGGRYGNEGLEMVAQQAYAVADAMLRERAKVSA